jgi:hypothetical protein
MTWILLIFALPNLIRKTLETKDAMTHELNTPELRKLVGTNLDFAQYIGLLFRKEIEAKKKTVEIGTIKLGKKEYSISVGGLANTTSYKGEAVNTPAEYGQYYKEGREDELNHDNMSYLEVKGDMEGKTYYGIFFSIADALAHMTKIEKGEILAENELVSA